MLLHVPWLYWHAGMFRVGFVRGFHDLFPLSLLGFLKPLKRLFILIEGIIFLEAASAELCWGSKQIHFLRGTPKAKITDHIPAAEVLFTPRNIMSWIY
uniref:Uncharacterized protein n=1 Tax=Phasianus colchicus TaxID=9054 RepID=A0A669QTG1_PHACC